MKPHKHAELIKAWADGAEIEWLNGCKWENDARPNWCLDLEYRIKPDVVRYAYVAMFGQDYLGLNNQISEYANLKLTFDTTGKLKSAEVLK